MILESAEAAEAAFYETFRKVDAESMAEIWLPDDSVYCIHPNGPVNRGYDAVIDSWITLFSGARETAVDYSVLLTYGDDHTQVHLVEEYVGTGKTAVSVLATNTYQWSGKGWKMASHHASLKPGASPDIVPSTLH